MAFKLNGMNFGEGTGSSPNKQLDAVTDKLSGVKDKMSNLKDKINPSAIKEKLSSKASNIKEGIASKKDAIKESLAAKKDALKTKASNVKQNIASKKDAIKQGIASKKEAIGKGLDNVQTSLSVAGLTPGAGIIPAAANTAISGARAGYSKLFGGDTKKHMENMAINAGSMIPVAGQAIAAGGLARDISGRATASKKDPKDFRFFGKA